MKNGKCLLLAFLLVLLLVGPLCSASTKPAYGTAATLLNELTQELRVLTDNWEKSNQLLMRSLQDLEREQAKALRLQQRSEKLQARLESYQAQSLASSETMRVMSNDFDLLSQDLSELRSSLAAGIRRHKRQQIIVGIISAVTGAALGIVVAFIILASMN